MAYNKEFLFDLLSVAGPSGQERRAADIYTKEAEKFARVHEDHYGNVYAEVGPEGADAIALLGHLDEIGLIVSHIDDDGFIEFLPLGGWDPQVLVAQRVRILAPGGDIIGVIGKRAIHTMSPEDVKNASKIKELWIDVGLEADEVKAKIPVGTSMVIDQGPIEVGNNIVSRAIDNRIGAFIVLEAMRKVKDEDLKHRIVAIGTAQEELGCFGAKLTGYHLNPVAAIAVDVTHETKQKGVEAQEYGKKEFNSGANITTGPMQNPKIFAGLKKAAEDNNIKHTVSATGRLTYTDADTIGLAGTGVPNGLISIPNRYMHSPCEMITPGDIEACIDVIAEWIKALPADPDFSRK